MLNKQIDNIGEKLHDVVIRKYFEVDNVEISGGGYKDIDVPITVPSGYKNIGSVNVDMRNATTNGVNVSYCVVAMMRNTSTTVVTVRVRNLGTSVAKIRIYANVLFLKNY